jgi:D-amino-acid dehydrogenase
MLRLLAASRPSKVVEARDAMADLMAEAMASHRALLDAAGRPELLRSQGWLGVFRKVEPRVRQDLAIKHRYGIRTEELGGSEIRQLVPALARDLDWGVLYPDCGHVLDPFEVVQAYAKHFVAQGGTIKRVPATGFAIADGRVAAVRTETGDEPADLVVLAAGAWSRPLAKLLGAKVPLDTERGYHVTLPDPGIDVPMPVFSGDHRMSITPMTPGLRIGGTAEFAGLDAPANPARYGALIERGRELLPDLQSDFASEWMGHRPATPDSIPVIGRAPRADNAYFAFGHGHLGLTAGPVTGRAIADLAAGRPPVFDVSPFRVERFG